MRLSVLLERTSVRSVRKIMQRYKKNPTFASFVVIFFDKCNIKHAHLCASAWCLADEILTERDSKIDFLAKMLAYVKKK